MGSKHDEAEAKDPPETNRAKEGRRNGSEDSLHLLERISARTEGLGTTALGPKRNISVERAPGSKGRFRQLHLQAERGQVWSARNMKSAIRDPEIPDQWQDEDAPFPPEQPVDTHRRSQRKNKGISPQRLIDTRTHIVFGMRLTPRRV